MPKSFNKLNKRAIIKPKLLALFLIPLLIGFMGTFLFIELEPFGLIPSQDLEPEVLGVSAPNVLSFQGRLTDLTDTPITSSSTVTFKLYNVASGGTALWTGSCSITPDQDGIFDVLLGSTCGSAIPDTLFSENDDTYLGITVGSDSEMSPRQKIAAAAYALNADTLQGFSPSQTPIANQVVVLDEAGNLDFGVIDPQITSSGDIILGPTENVGIGTTNPTFKLDVNGTARFADNVRLDSGKNLVFYDHNATFPTATGGFVWDLNNDSAKIYAQQPSSDYIDFVFKITDNVGSTDRFLYWLDSYTGETDDAYPLLMDGVKTVFNYPSVFGTGTSKDIDFYIMGSGESSLSNAYFFGDAANKRVGIGTTSPAYKLEVAGDINTSTGTYRMAGIDYGQFFIDSAGTNGFLWSSDGTGRGTWVDPSTIGTTDTNDYVDSISFNTTDGVLTLGRTGTLVDLTQDLDGRYLTSYTETDPVWVSQRGDYFKLSDNETVTGRPAFNGGVSGTSSPFSVDSNTVVTNLNADLLDGQHSSYYLDDTDTNDYVDSISFNTTNGVLTLGRTGALVDLTQDLDGRYLTSYTETDPIWVSERGGYFKLSDNETVTGRPAFNGGVSGTSSPFSVDSNTVVTNLNADLLDGHDSSYFLLNPMTTAGDIIYGASSGSPSRLAGSTVNGYVLKYNTTTDTPYWAEDIDTDTNTDRLVAVDSAAAPDYLGASATSGAIRIDSSGLTYTDGGNFITLGLEWDMNQHVTTLSDVSFGSVDTGSGAKYLGDAAITNGDTNSIPTNDQVYDFVTGLGYEQQDNYVDTVAFNTGTGVLTLGRTGTLGDLTQDLDGRFLLLSGGTMSGNISMANAHSITGIFSTQFYNTETTSHTAANGMLIYDQSDGLFIYDDYIGGARTASGWARVWDQNNDGTGSGLDADLLDGSHASSFVITQYNSSLNSDSRNSRGVTRLYRRDSDTDYSVQTYWTGTRWRLYGYSGDSAHADTEVGYALSAGSSDTVDSLHASSFLRSDANDTFTATSLTLDSGAYLNTRLIGSLGTELGIAAGEMWSTMNGNMTGETLWLGGESGVKIVSSPDNMSSGWAGRHEATLVDSSGNSSLPGNLWLSGGSRNFGVIGNNNLGIYTNGVERIRILGDTGGVGIAGPGGTVPNAGQALHVMGNARFQQDTPEFQLHSSGGGNAYYIGANISDTVDGGFVIGEGSSMNTGTHRLAIDGIGRVGIGTSSPNQKLEVAGHLRLNTSNAMLEAVPGQSLIIKQSSTGNMHFDTDTSFYWRNLSGVNKMHLNTSDGSLAVAGYVGATTINTGYGYNELYAMNQNVRTSDSVQFARATATYHTTASSNTSLEMRWNHLVAVNNGGSSYNMELHPLAGTYVQIAGSGNLYTNNNSYARTRSGGAIDIAEWIYTPESNLEAGDIVIPHQTIDNATTKSNNQYNSSIIGVISTKPHLIMGEEIKEQYDEKFRKPLALSGRIPVKIMSSGETIDTGERITSSSIPGFGMKADSEGMTVGVTLEKFVPNESTCKEISSIESIKWPEDNGKNPGKPCFRLPDGTYVGKVMLLVNLSWFDPRVYVNNPETIENLQIEEESQTSQYEELLARIEELEEIYNSQEDTIDVAKVLQLTQTEDGNIEMLGGKIIFEGDGTLAIRKLQVEEDYTAGTGTILGAQTQVKIETKAVTENSKILVTPRTKTNNKQLFTTDIVEGESFYVNVEEAIEKDITFDWFIVDVGP